MKKFCLFIAALTLLLTAALTVQADTQIVLTQDGAQITGAGATAENNVLTLTEGGAYTVSGTWPQGQIVIKAGKDDEVVLTLTGVQITHNSAAALYCEQAANVRILLAENTENMLISGAQVDVSVATPDENASGGALHVRANLTIEGDGALAVGGYINNGIHCTDVLTIAGGAVSVEAINNGLKGKDGVVIAGGDVRVKTAADAVQSDADLTVSGGNVYLVTGAGSGEGNSDMQLFEMPEMPQGVTIPEGMEMPELPEGMEMPQMPEGMQSPESMEMPEMPDGMQPPEGMEAPQMPDGMQAPGMPGGATPPVATEEVAPESTAQPDARADRKQGGKQDRGFGGGGMGGGFGGMRGGFEWETESSADDGISRKGLKAAANLYVTGGTLVIDTQDDALHAGVHIGVMGGDMTLSSGDDGLHADESLTIDDGKIAILTAYEGIEAQIITVNGGDITLTASDDGFNANGGANNFGKMMRAWGGQTETEDESSDIMPQLLINGGNVYVNAQGDGLDSNGDLIVAGGYVVVDGPQNGANGALDSGMENGGKCFVTGGTVLAIGAAGMSESFDENSTQCTFTAAISVRAGDEMTITAPDGTELMSHTAAKSAQQLVFSCPELAVGETYTITCGENTVTVEQKDIVTGGSGYGGFGWGRW